MQAEPITSVEINAMNQSESGEKSAGKHDTCGWSENAVIRVTYGQGGKTSYLRERRETWLRPSLVSTTSTSIWLTKIRCKRLGGKPLNKVLLPKQSRSERIVWIWRNSRVICNGLFVLDVDECQSHDCDQGECTNTVGSFSCKCIDGYEENNQRVCVGK